MKCRVNSFGEIVIIISILLISFNVSAEVAKRDAGGAAAAKAQMMLRQIAADRDTLKTENTSLQSEIEKQKKKIDDLKGENKKLSSKIDNAGQTIDKYNEVNEKLRDRINKDRDRAKELIAKFKETIITLRKVELKRSQLDEGLKATTQELSTCTNNNIELYKTNLELVELYKDKSIWDAVVQKEPVTQLGRVKIENIAQKYTDKVQEFKFVSNELDE